MIKTAPFSRAFDSTGDLTVALALAPVTLLLFFFPDSHSVDFSNLIFLLTYGLALTLAAALARHFDFVVPSISMDPVSFYNTGIVALGLAIALVVAFVRRAIAFVVAFVRRSPTPAAVTVVAPGTHSIPGRGTRGLVALATLLLPAVQRPRYREEFNVELAELPPAQWWGYSLRVLISAWQLRRALVARLYILDGEPAPQAER